MKGKNLQPRLLYPERISFKFIGEIKSFTDKQKLREFSTTKPALQQMLKELLKKMVIGTYISIITLNVDGLNVQPKDTGLLNGYKNMTHIYAVYKRPTSDLGTHTD